MVNDACFFEKKILISGTILRFEGQLSTFKPHAGSPRYRCLFPEPPPPGAVPGCQEAGILGAVSGVIGLIHANEALREILGIGQSMSGRFLLFKQRIGFRAERIAGASETHREYTNLQANFANRRNDLFAKARLAMEKTGDLKKVIVDVQKYNLDAAKYKGAIPLINSTILRRALTAKPEGKFMVYENLFGQAEANP